VPEVHHANRFYQESFAMRGLAEEDPPSQGKFPHIYFVTAGFDEDGNPNTVESTSGQSNIVQITFSAGDD
jgi:hypothetical protein